MRKRGHTFLRHDRKGLPQFLPALGDFLDVHSLAPAPGPFCLLPELLLARWFCSLGHPDTGLAEPEQ